MTSNNSEKEAKVRPQTVEKITWIETWRSAIKKRFMPFSRENKFIRMMESPYVKLEQFRTRFISIYRIMSTSCAIQWAIRHLLPRSIIHMFAYFQFSMCCWTQTVRFCWQWKSLFAHILNLTQLLPTKISTDFVANATLSLLMLSFEMTFFVQTWNYAWIKLFFFYTCWSELLHSSWKRAHNPWYAGYIAHSF